MDYIEIVAINQDKNKELIIEIYNSKLILTLNLSKFIESISYFTNNLHEFLTPSIFRLPKSNFLIVINSKIPTNTLFITLNLYDYKLKLLHILESTNCICKPNPLFNGMFKLILVNNTKYNYNSVLLTILNDNITFTEINDDIYFSNNDILYKSDDHIFKEIITINEDKETLIKLSDIKEFNMITIFNDQIILAACEKITDDIRNSVELAIYNIKDNKLELYDDIIHSNVFSHIFYTSNKCYIFLERGPKLLVIDDSLEIIEHNLDYCVIDIDDYGMLCNEALWGGIVYIKDNIYYKICKNNICSYSNNHNITMNSDKYVEYLNIIKSTLNNILFNDLINIILMY